MRLLVAGCCMLVAGCWLLVKKRSVVSGIAPRPFPFRRIRSPGRQNAKKKKEQAGIYFFFRLSLDLRRSAPRSAACTRHTARRGPPDRGQRRADAQRSFALHSRAPYQAFRRRRVSLAVRSHSENLLGEPEAEATNGTPAADGPGTQGTHRSRHSSGSIITEAAHNAEGTPQRAHGSPRTPARTLRGNARTTHAKWIFIRIQHADDA